MRILFVCLNDFSAPTEKEVLGFAQRLTTLGHHVLISLGGDVATAEREGISTSEHLSVRAHRFRGPQLRTCDRRAARAFGPDLIHAYNPRMPVVAAARSYARATRAPVLVHFEDDEWSPPAAPPDEAWWRPLGRRGRRLVARLQPSAWLYATPASLRWVARAARALDAHTPVLAREVEQRLGRACALLLPVTPITHGAAASETVATLASDATVLITGSILPVSLEDYRLAMTAVAEVRNRGHSLVFVHAGSVHPRIDATELAREAGLDAESTVFLGYRPFASIPGLLRQATVLVQPGAPSEFNRLRLPTKLQGYLASGTATVTFAVGIGELLQDRHEVLKTHTAEAVELADRIEELLLDPDLRATLSREGPAAARRLFDPQRNTQHLLAHYREALAT